MKKNNTLTTILVLIGAILLVYGVGKSGIFNTEKNNDFIEHIEEKEKEIKELEASNLIPNIIEYGKLKPIKAEVAAPLEPKIFIVENNPDELPDSDEVVREYIYSSVYFQIPKDLRATNVDELNVLVQLTSTYKETGTYTGGKPAYTNFVHVKILDMPSTKLIAERILTDSPPFTIAENQSSGRGYVGESDISEYILDACGFGSLIE